jgi:hypothetical protein
MYGGKITSPKMIASIVYLVIGFTVNIARVGGEWQRDGEMGRDGEGQ